MPSREKPRLTQFSKEIGAFPRETDHACDWIECCVLSRLANQKPKARP